ncbi:MAG: hypothetical protein L0209_02855, partial [candidate division Zixibacteria bacterium]|nr:hypothetical protein [candidate division Zixibacteria bacterium]
MQKIDSGRFLFLIVVLLQAAFLLYNVIQKRMATGHDTFQYLTLQYYFLNNAVFSGEIAQWMPFMT